MILTDTLQKAPVGGLKVPNFKGHVRFIIKDKKGRITKSYEADNLVTNVVRDVFANNYMGALDPSVITPLWEKMYGGLLLFRDGHQNPNDANDYWVKSDAHQFCCGHAGHDNPDDISDDITRGMYNTALQVKNKSSIKQVWEWNANTDYIPISAASLCPESVGNVGTPKDSQAFRNFSPFEILSTRIPSFTANMISPENILFMIDDFTGGWFTMGEPGEYVNMASRFETHYLTIYKKRLALKKAGLYECDNVVDDFTTHFTIDLGARNIYCQPAYCYTGGYLWIFSNITGIGGTGDGDDLTYGNTMTWWKIDVVNETLVDSGIWVNDPNESGVILGPCCIEARGWYGALAPVSPGTRSIFPGIPFSFDTTNRKAFLFPVCDGPVSHATAPAFNVVGTLSYCPDYSAFTVAQTYVDKQYEFMSSMYSDQYQSLVVMPGRVLNGQTYFTCVTDPLWVDNRDVFITKACQWAMVTPTKPLSLVVPIGCGMSWGGAPRYLVMNKFLQTTKINLPSMLVKYPNESLTVEYTLTQI